MNLELDLRFAGGCLRVLKPDDVHIGYVSGLNDPEVNRYLDGVKRVTQTERSVVEFVRNDLSAANAILFGIWLEDGAPHAGTVRLHGIDPFHKTAHIGICIFDKIAWGRGIGAKAIGAVTQWAMTSLGLRWVEAGAYEGNVASQKAFVSAGYDWMYDVCGKYLLEGEPVNVRVYAFRR